MSPPNPKYVPKSLSPKDRAAQLDSIRKHTDRPRVSYPHKRSPWVQKFEKKYKHKITDAAWIHKHILRRSGQQLILRRGRGAYYSAGSRPNQTPSSWAYARLAAVIMGSPARRVDM